MKTISNTQPLAAGEAAPMDLPLRIAASHWFNNIHHVAIVDANQRIIVQSMEKARAELFVRACNSHAGLVAALERALGRIKSFDEDYDLDDVYCAGEAALSLAKEGQP